MKVEYINPFITAAIEVTKTVLGGNPSTGPVTVRASTFTSDQCNIVCGITGEAQGQVIFGISSTTALKIASAMIGSDIKVFDQLAGSAIAELGNMISGNASALLTENGYVCDITPPTIIRGSSVKICTGTIPAVVVPVALDQGQMTITVGLQARK